MVRYAVAFAFGAMLAARPHSAAAQDEPPTRYDGQKVVRVLLDAPRTLMLMEQVSPDCWSHQVAIGLEADYRVRADDLAVLDAAGVRYHVLIDDVQRPIDEERARLEAGGFAERGWFSEFKTYADVLAYADALVVAHPGLVTRQVAGYSLEGREIPVLRFSAPNEEEGKPVLFLDGTQHAREWIAIMSVMYIADALANGYGSDPAITALLDRFVVYIVPVVNPDGYVYTWTKDRNWRKNKRLWSDSPVGVDNNRNWGYKWGLDGSSSLPGSDIYRGTAPFSEPENAALRDFVSVIPGLAGYIDFHSYGQLILSPWGYTSTPPAAIGSYTAVGNAMKAAIYAAQSVTYKVGIGNTLLYPTSGSAPDWFYGELGVPGWTIELTQGPCVIAPSAIIPTGRVALAAVLALGQNVCPADIDYNSWVNGDDSDAFAVLFVAGQPGADFDHNGFVNGDDIDFFMKAFLDGCF